MKSMQEIKALRSFGLTSLPRGKRERGRWKEKSGIRGNKVFGSALEAVGSSLSASIHP